MTVKTELKTGDCLDLLKPISDASIDLVYLDPPFFTETVQRLKTRDRTKEFSYHDIWGCQKKYTDFLFHRLLELKRVIKDSGSIFVHCDINATHLIRILLDDIFGQSQLRSEIIWAYKRWSNAKKGLLPAHQTIYFYSQSDNFKFNPIYNPYSESTNIDQILQKRTRDEHGKAVYARDQFGTIILDDEKRGVPLSDVWEIPYLNPKAKERVGYPTQKPILLLERIIRLTTDMGDTVLDPFCGSGTTLVAANLLERNAIGIDISEDAIALSQARLNNPIKSESHLLKKGREAYNTSDENALALLQGLDLIPVPRNQGIDAILKQQYKGTPVLIRVQKTGESLTETATLLSKAADKKCSKKAILVKTHEGTSLFEEMIPKNIEVIESVSLLIKRVIFGE
ncbi:MAG: site-specific DNA-methyltransferase [Candidatus Parabeggiatoa sp. nov. 3]|nr:MAG: site-specific DNA-methyltransferase [Gammaproteobacteria bacterium]RKZ81740.1 MAG: site-specific DNA-methyltransferase [Gammaproteobacteria bacterium]HEW98677.1 site-specific DNA-methyltransferase [Beggiatoa sp.]